jgi:tetratricopeptide (TPR) repeat protein
MSRRRRRTKARRSIKPIPLRPLFAILALLMLALFAAWFVIGRGPDPAGALARAQAYEAAGDMAAARVEAMNAVDHDPSDEASWRMLARAQIALGQGEAASGTIERATSAGVAETRTRHLAGEAALLIGDPRTALAATGGTPIDPEFFGQAARVRGRAFMALGDSEAAADAFTLAIEADEDDPELWIDIADFRLSTGEQAGAIEAIDRALELDTDNIEALIVKGRLVRQQYGLVASLAWFERAIEIDEGNIVAMLERAATLGEIGRMADMLAGTRAILAIDSSNAGARYLQAVLAARARNFTLARRLTTLTGGALDGRPSMMLLEAGIDFEQENYQATIRRLETLLEAQPANRTAQRLLGAAQFRAGDMRAALAALGPLADRPDADSYVLTLAGRAWEQRGDFGRAAPYLDRAARPIRAGLTPIAAATDFGLVDEPASGASTEVAAIRTALAQGRIGDAVARAERLRARNPGAPDAHILYGDALGAAGRYGDAAAAYASAANIRFSEAVALRMIDTLLRAGQTEEALRTLSLFRQQNPRNLSTAMVAAQLNLSAGRWQQAAAILEQLRLRIGDRDAAILANLAWARHELGEDDHAVALARRAYLLVPMNASTSEIYGWVLFDSGRDRELGLELLEKAQSLAPGDAHIAERLAMARAAIRAAG